jgi:hypothetical protein
MYVATVTVEGEEQKGQLLRDHPEVGVDSLVSWFLFITLCQARVRVSRQFFPFLSFPFILVTPRAALLLLPWVR